MVRGGWRVDWDQAIGLPPSLSLDLSLLAVGPDLTSKWVRPHLGNKIMEVPAVAYAVLIYWLTRVFWKCIYRNFDENMHIYWFARSIWNVGLILTIHDDLTADVRVQEMNP